MSENGKYERDGGFAHFVKKMGEATSPQPADRAVIERFRGRLPAQMLRYWEHEGWGGWRDGLFWVVDPEDFEDVKRAWFAETPLEPETDLWHVIGRTAFGRLYLMGEKSGAEMEIEPAFGMITASQDKLRPQPPEKRDFKAMMFFSHRGPEECDEQDTNDNPLFQRALKKLGPVGPDEMYGYRHMLVAGGQNVLDNLEKTDLLSHLMLLRDLHGPASLPFWDYDIGAFASQALEED